MLTFVCMLRCWTWDAVPNWLLYSSVLHVRRYADTATFSQFRTGRKHPLPSLAVGVSAGDCGIGSGCCGGGVILLGLRESALLCQGLLFEPKASSAPGTMILAIHGALAVSPTEPCPNRCHIPGVRSFHHPSVRSFHPAHTPSMHRKRRPPQTETAAFPSHIIHRKSKHRKILIY